MALAITMTQSTDTSAAMSGARTVKPTNGIGTLTMVNPASVSTDPDNTMPATLAGADTSFRSSMKPVENMMAAATSAPITLVGLSNTAESPPSRDATASPATSPAIMAAPPRVGVGASWTLRSPGWTIAPRRRAHQITIGIVPQVTAKLAAATTAKAAQGVTPRPG